jgi:hypothetical protein
MGNGHIQRPKRKRQKAGVQLEVVDHDPTGQVT